MAGLSIGDAVRDVFTGQHGVVIIVSTYRCTVDFGTYKMIGCPSWFERTQGVHE